MYASSKVWSMNTFHTLRSLSFPTPFSFQQHRPTYYPSHCIPTNLLLYHINVMYHPTACFLEVHWWLDDMHFVRVCGILTMNQVSRYKSPLIHSQSSCYPYYLRLILVPIWLGHTHSELTLFLLFDWTHLTGPIQIRTSLGRNDLGWRTAILGVQDLYGKYIHIYLLASGRVVAIGISPAVSLHISI